MAATPKTPPTAPPTIAPTGTEEDGLGATEEEDVVVVVAGNGVVGRGIEVIGGVGVTGEVIVAGVVNAVIGTSSLPLVQDSMPRKIHHTSGISIYCSQGWTCD
jgi:hypothetical protein